MSHYTQFFGFNECPFDYQASEAPVMGTQALRTAFEKIDSAIDRGESTILLYGPPGVGLSSLARVLPRLFAGVRPITLVKDPSKACIEFENQLASTPSRPPGESASAPPLLIIDNAELLAETDWNRLTDTLARAVEAPRIICIFCLSGVNPNRDTSGPIGVALSRLSPTSIRLEPLGPDGVRHYIRRHLERVGGAFEELFRDDIVEAIHRHAEGLPRDVSRLSEDLLATATSRQTRTLDPDWLEESSEFEGNGWAAATAGGRCFSSPVTRASTGEMDIGQNKTEGLDALDCKTDWHGSAHPAPRTEPTIPPLSHAKRTRWLRWLVAMVGLSLGCTLMGAFLDPFGPTEKNSDFVRPVDATAERAGVAEQPTGPDAHVPSTARSSADSPNALIAERPAPIRAREASHSNAAEPDAGGTGGSIPIVLDVLDGSVLPTPIGAAAPKTGQPVPGAISTTRDEVDQQPEPGPTGAQTPTAAEARRVGKNRAGPPEAVL